MTLEEMDVEAVVRRAPELALIDELAHTNAPGSRQNQKRYEDIEEVLDAGIDVISTVNIQHLESLNDLVFELTGVRVRETVPDRVLDEADEVVLVDLTPEDLRERIQAGKVYPAGRIESALAELLQGRQPVVPAPACPAGGGRGRRGPARDRCDRPGRPAARSASGSSSWSSRDRPASACCAVHGAPDSGWEPTSTRSGCIRPAIPCLDRDRTALAALRRLAVTLGVHFLEEEDGDFVAAVKRVVVDRGTTYVFWIAPHERRLELALGRSQLYRLIEALPGIDIRLSADRPRGDRSRSEASSGCGARRRPGSDRRVLVAFSGRLDPVVLAAALRIARAENAVPGAGVSDHRPVLAALRPPAGARGRTGATGAGGGSSRKRNRAGVEVDAALERGRSLRDGLARLWSEEHFDRIILPAIPRAGTAFRSRDLAWALMNAPTETIVLRPAPAEAASSTWGMSLSSSRSMRRLARLEGRQRHALARRRVHRRAGRRHGRDRAAEAVRCP